LKAERSEGFNLNEQLQTTKVELQISTDAQTKPCYYAPPRGGYIKTYIRLDAGVEISLLRAGAFLQNYYATHQNRDTGRHLLRF
jgi:hypothetical protein